jgi:hypothetical protein
MNKALDGMHFGQVSTGLSHPSVIIKRIIDSLGIGWVKDNYPNYIDAMLDKLPLRKGVIEIAIQDPAIKTRLITKIFELAGSYTFDIANKFIDRFHDVEDILTNTLTDDECLRLTCEIIKSARNGAWRSEEVVTSKFASFSRLREKALSRLESHPHESLLYLKEAINNMITIEAFKSRYLEAITQPD